MPSLLIIFVKLTNNNKVVKMTTMKTEHKHFEAMLKAKGISKKAFSAYSSIPYYTVAGWKKSGQVPAYAMVLLGHMPSAKEQVSVHAGVLGHLRRSYVDS